MGENYYVGKLFSNISYVFRGKLLVHFTTTRPADHLVIKFRAGTVARIFRGEDYVATRLARDIPRQVLVGKKDDRVRMQRFDHGGSIGRGATNVRLSLHVRVSIDIG